MQYSRSRPLILDPLSGHPESSIHVANPNLRGTIKELAQLDGGFVVSHDGIFLSACRYLDAVVTQVDVPLGLGSRHIAAANMSAVTKAGVLWSPRVRWYAFSVTGSWLAKSFPRPG